MTVATATKPHPIYLAGRWVDSPDVLEVSNPADPDNPDAAAATNATPQFLVTVEVTPEDATKLIHGVNNYTLYAGLRGPELKVDPRLTTTDQTILPGLVK